MTAAQNCALWPDPDRTHGDELVSALHRTIGAFCLCLNCVCAVCAHRLTVAKKSSRVAGEPRTTAQTGQGDFVGVISGGGTPGPISNPAVKPASADGTGVDTLWERRSSPTYLLPSFSLYPFSLSSPCSFFVPTHSLSFTIIHANFAHQTNKNRRSNPRLLRDSHEKPLKIAADNLQNLPDSSRITGLHAHR